MIVIRKINSSILNEKIRNRVGLEHIIAIGINVIKVFLKSPEKIESGRRENLIKLFDNQPADAKLLNQKANENNKNSTAYQISIPHDNDIMNIIILNHCKLIEYTRYAFTKMNHSIIN